MQEPLSLVWDVFTFKNKLKEHEPGRTTLGSFYS
jgi:hypothetical protein